MFDIPNRPTPLAATARRLRVPPAWLRAEAEANRIPHVRAGDVFLFDPEEVERILMERLKQAARPGEAADAQ